MFSLSDISTSRISDLFSAGSGVLLYAAGVLVDSSLLQIVGTAVGVGWLAIGAHREYRLMQEHRLRKRKYDDHERNRHA